MYMLINLASKAVLKKKDPDTRHLCCSKCTACEAFVMTVHLREALVCPAFTDDELKAVLRFWYLCCIAIEWNQWIVIFLFVFCVFVQCVLINLLDNSDVTLSLSRVFKPRNHADFKRVKFECIKWNNNNTSKFQKQTKQHHTVLLKYYKSHNFSYPCDKVLHGSRQSICHY